MYKIVILFLCNINFCLTQNHNFYGKALYSKMHNFENNRNLNYSDAQKMFFRAADNATFVLEFSKFQSSFKIKEDMVVDYNYKIKRAAVAVGGGKGVYFSDLQKGISLRQVESVGNLFLIKSIISDLNWKITKESKMISGHRCYKAQLIKTFKTSQNELKTITIVAWFNPNIPISFGPIGYCGLPGLIFELKNGRATYTLIELEFETESEVKIKQPDKGKLVSEETFDILVENAVKNRERKSQKIKKRLQDNPTKLKKNRGKSQNFKHE